MHYYTDLHLRFGQDETPDAALVVHREPWWSYVAYMVMDRLCSLTAHRFGCCRMVLPALNLAERHEETWSTSISPEEATDWYHWLGRDVWWEDDDLSA